MLYALLDTQSLQAYGLSIQEVLKFINTLQAPILQYRNKTGSITEKKNDLIFIRENYFGKIIINDTIELAQYADGLHLGQEDFAKIADSKKEAVDIIKKSIGNKIIGLSTHNKDEVLEANELMIDYIGLGAYRTTQTKENVIIGGKNLLEIAKLSTHPVAIIGGVALSDIFGDEIAYRVVGSDIYKQINKE